MDVFTSTQMDGWHAEEQAKRAISHVLRQIATRREAAQAMGLGSESYSLLTEAYAALYKLPVREVRECFLYDRGKERR